MARTAYSKNNPVAKGKKTNPAKIDQKGKSRKSLSIKEPKISQSTPSKNKGKHRHNLVLREIAYYQQATRNLIPKSPFISIVRGAMSDISKSSKGQQMRFTATSLDMLQEAFEAHLTSLSEAAYYCTMHAKRCTLFPKDLRLIRTIKDMNI